MFVLKSEFSSLFQNALIVRHLWQDPDQNCPKQRPCCVLRVLLMLSWPLVMHKDHLISIDL